MLKIGLTGGIGSGKTTVAKIFQVLGIPVFDADYEAKKIMNTNEDLKSKLKLEFGDLVFKNDTLNKEYLAKIVFNNKYKLEKLNALVHPITIEKSTLWADNQRSPYIIKEAALFFEAGSTLGLDYIIGVFTPKYIRINRLLKRDNSTKEEIENRMNTQISDTIKMKLCDFVIVNDEQKLLIPQIINLHKKILLL